MNETTTKPDIKIAGSGTVATGTYRLVNVAGSATLTGDIACDTLKIAGAANGRGSLKAETLTVSGALAYQGDIDAGNVRVSGSGDFRGSMKAGTLHVAGSAEVGGDLSGELVEVRGQLRVHGDCEAERFSAEGAFSVSGLLNAGAVDVTLWGPCTAGDIGGEAVVVRYGRGPFRRFVAMFVPAMEDRLRVESIEGDDVRLEYTTARAVRGKSVTIGPGCDIGLVEYAESYTVASDAKVKESRKTEGAGSPEPQNNEED